MSSRPRCIREQRTGAALQAIGSANTKIGVAKRAAGNKISVWRSRRRRGVIALVAGGCVLGAN
jgi:hypothetical protein